VRMTTKLDVDLRELFVVPKVLVRARRAGRREPEATEAGTPMDLAAARRLFGPTEEISGPPQSSRTRRRIVPALNQVRHSQRNVLVGVPGAGKSTFLEWLQLKIAAVEEELVMAGKQAIPLLVRVRQLDPRRLPLGPELIEKATASRDRAALMPPGWIDRQMKAGRVLFMLDGLDEVAPDLRDEYLTPGLWQQSATSQNAGISSHRGRWATLQGCSAGCDSTSATSPISTTAPSPSTLGIGAQRSGWGATRQRKKPAERGPRTAT